MLIWLSLWSKVQTVYTWSRWCHSCLKPIVSCLIKIQTCFTFVVSTYTGYPEKEVIKWVFLLLMAVIFTHCCHQQIHAGKPSDTCGRMRGSILSMCRHVSCQGGQVRGTLPNGTPLSSSYAPLQMLTQHGRSRPLLDVTSDYIIHTTLVQSNLIT